MMPEQKGPQVTIELTVKNKDGVVLRQTKEEAHSWLTNYYAWLAMNMRLAVTQSLRDDGGSNHTCAGGVTDAWDPSGCKTQIAIGSSSTAWAVGQYKLQTLNAKETVGEVSYNSATKKVVFSTSITLAVARTIREVGILFNGVKPLMGSVFNCYIERTVLASAVAIPAGGSVVVKYTITH